MTLSRRQWLKRCSLTGLCLLPAFAHPGLKTTDRDMQRLHGSAFGTQWTLTTHADCSGDDIRRAVHYAINIVNQEMSPYRTDSAISRFNRSSSQDWQVMSPHCAIVIATSLELASLSQGVFDPTIGPLVNRFGFGPITGVLRPDFRALEFRGSALKKHDVKLTLDLCAIAKGYAIDLIAEHLINVGIENFLLECGGELRSSGHHPTGRQWLAGVEQPTTKSDSLYTVIELDNRALATSGTHRNAFIYNGQHYHHLIDTRSRKPVVQDLLSVSVLSKHAMLADGWATALLLSGVEAGPVLAQQQGIDALFILNSNKGYREISVGDFSHHRVWNSSWR